MTDPLVIYLCAVNAAAVIFYRADKRKAVKGRQRIPEKILILLAAAGGSAGAFAAMHMFHHKTKKPLFYIGVPFLLVLQIIVIFMYYV